MSAKVVPLRPPLPAYKPTAEELLTRARDLYSVSSLNMRWDHEHINLRFQQRGISMRQAIETLKCGDCVSGPTFDKYGDWRIKLRRKVAGRRVQIVLAVKETHFVLVTVI